MLPLVWVSEKITAVFERKDRSSGLSRAEVAATVELGHDEGALGRLESKIMRNLTRLQSMRVVDIMTPRTVIFMVPQITTVGEYLERHADMPFSRIPIHAEDPDDLTGFVLKSEILLARAEGHVDWPLSRLRRDLEEIPETAPVWSTFEQFIGAREHIRSVRDEYGGLAGVVTLEDVVETLLGMEIVDEADVDVDMREKARKLWQQRARRMGIETGEQA